MPSEISLLAGMVLSRLRQLSEPVRISTPFRTRENTMALWECWGAWKRYVRCGRVDFVPNIRSNCLFSLPKNRRALGSAVSEAGCCLARCLGSRLLSGTLSPEAARKLTDNDG